MREPIFVLMRDALNYVADMTCIDRNGEWTLKPGYDPQKVLDALDANDEARDA